jgi:anthranilate phosphoribosyltransferase
MKHAIGPRRELGIRTFFNILGPMTNPAGARRQLMGVYDAALVPKAAGVLADLGSDRAFVVHGEDGLDEITTTAETTVAEVCGGKVRTFTITPEEFGIRRAESAALAGGDAGENAGIFMAVLSGEAGARRDIVLLNSAFAICAGGLADTPAEGLRLAEKSIDSGAAMEAYRRMKEFTNA